jgi:hypothetical protein
MDNILGQSVRHLILAIVAFGLAAATATAAPAAPVLIYKVDKVAAAIIRNHLVVSASGAVNSGGWTLPRLHMKEVHIPESDTEVIEFLATPPVSDSAVIQALLPIQTTATFPLPRYGAVQVTVVAQTNSVTAPIQVRPAASAKPVR